jgi:hypothetical protein
VDFDAPGTVPPDQAENRTQICQASVDDLQFVRDAPTFETCTDTEAVSSKFRSNLS